MKKILATALALILAMGCGVVGTLAYLTSTSEVVTNTFTVGNVKILLDEDDVDNSSSETENYRDTANQYKLIPGDTYAKDPAVWVKEGSEDSWYFVAVKNEISAATITAETDGHKTIETQMEDNGWVELKTASADSYKVYYYNGTLPEAAAHPNANVTDKYSKLPVFEEVTLIADMDEETLGVNDTIKLMAYAIQKNNLATAEAAWTAGNWTLNF